jgi:hypothetical protein
MPTQTRNKPKAKKAEPRTFSDPKANRVIKALIKGRKTSPVTMDYLRVMEGDRSYGQLATRRTYAILENLRDDVKVTGLVPAGKNGATRGRWRVTEDTVPAAAKALDTSREIVKREQTEAKAKQPSSRKPSTKDRVLSGEIAEVAAANPDLAEQSKNVQPAPAKKVGVKVEA